MDIIVNLTGGCDIALLSPALLLSGSLWALPAPAIEALKFGAKVVRDCADL